MWYVGDEDNPGDITSGFEDEDLPELEDDEDENENELEDSPDNEDNDDDLPPVLDGEE